MGFYYSDDPLRDHDRYEADREDWLDSLPKCDHCGDPIQDEEYCEIEGAKIHIECTEDYCIKNYKKQNTYL